MEKMSNQRDNHGRQDKQHKAFQRRTMEQAIGVLHLYLCTPSQAATKELIKHAWRDVFNVDRYLKLKKQKASPELIDAFQHGMQLEDVFNIVPNEFQSSVKLVLALFSNEFYRSIS